MVFNAFFLFSEFYILFLYDFLIFLSDLAACLSFIVFIFAVFGVLGEVLDFSTSVLWGARILFAASNSCLAVSVNTG